ncbi:P-loop containing nucleoside triphosphate hydrolase protein [Ilyonectria robusta]|uniref:P-loop containing nucleoside triphosphate hydrolase protein n=1 Tax=Ilyonectria robusta TaxID=1079257 RepID=UPI001E8EE430|nr:P-loop containing nucleoside triphosphate hydrolase protein [Ilyonectria robusta]KAH8694493.1 P-loop containing nucleoside triphosphate hydrolase protein [Ilyonectria robusta]
MAQTLSKEITGFDITVRGATAEPALEHRNLWMAYKPGVLLYYKRNGIEGLLILRQMDFKKRKDTRLDSWGITSYFIKSNGDSVGHVRHFVIVQHYDGCKPLCQMPIFPLCFHPEKERIASDLLERGKKYLSMLGVHHRFYDGVAKLSNYHSPAKFHSSSVKSRVMIDCQRFYRDTGSPVEFIAGCPVVEVESGNHTNLRDEDVMTCPAYIQGYSLANKLWGFFEVAKLHQVEFDMDAFSKLVLEEGTKQLIFSLVQSRESRKLEFDDHIKGKGKGLIFLLHGPPGVGKTLTAESIADQTRRPLVTLHSGQIIGTSPFVERRLENILSLVTRWNAVVLLDEADVFMQERAVHELERNALVSTLLRIVEYFDGIMFLTTNRFESIDTAFKSRVHLAVSYPPLSTDSKKELWRESVTRACAERRPPWVTERFLKAVAESPLNGREIKNTVGMAHALAQNGKRPMKPEDIFQGIQAMQSFESDFNAQKTMMGSTKRLVSAPEGIGSRTLPIKRPWWRFW